tara:strand:+ start:502 stop:681 length:180 start_codon:yes stop_codon:yes gene_type:complete
MSNTPRFKNLDRVYTVVGGSKGMILAVIYGLQGISYHVRLEDDTTDEFLPHELGSTKEV